jgi:hypothetical protein
MKRISMLILVGILLACIQIPVLAYNPLKGELDPLTTEDKVLLGTWAVLDIIDWSQTRYIAAHPEQYYEKNPLLSEHPSVSDVDQHFLISAAGTYLIYKLLPAKVRKHLAISGIRLEAFCTSNNTTLGIRTTF